VPDSRTPRSRFVVDASARRQAQPTRSKPASSANELWIAISVIVAAALATFLALFITSRPFDPETSSLAPQQTVPSGPITSPSSKPSPTVSATPQTKPSVQQSPTVSGGEIATPVDDASIQSRIDSAFAADAALAKLDVSTLVENGKVTVVGSVRSGELKQRVERTIRALKGVTSVDNQLVVNDATP
jgi:hypothetical protein